MASALKTMDDASTTTSGSQLQCAMAIAKLSRKGRSVLPAPIQQNHAISRDRLDGNADAAVGPEWFSMQPRCLLNMSNVFLCRSDTAWASTEITLSY